jgi:fluoroacetyl-CoA thioesterase
LSNFVQCMKSVFRIGDKKEYRKIVAAEDVAAFQGEIVHNVCSTFALARDVEWTTRQFVLEMKDDDEEGVGTFLTIQHRSPAFVGEQIEFFGTVDELNGHELICLFEAKVGNRLIATGKTGQKILKKEKIKSLFEKH